MTNLTDEEFLQYLQWLAYNVAPCNPLADECYHRFAELQGRCQRLSDQLNHVWDEEDTADDEEEWGCE